MRLILILNGLLIVLTACASPDVSQLREDGESQGVVQQDCGRFIVPNVIEAVGVSASGFGVPVDSVTFEGVDCFRDGSLALNAFSQHQQVVVNGSPVRLYVRDNKLVAVAEDQIVGEQPLQEESYGKELNPTGRWVLPVDEKSIAQGDILTWAL